MIASTYVIEHAALSNLEVRNAADLPISELRFAVSDKLPELSRLFDHALASISEKEHEAIGKKWIGVAGLAPDWSAILRVAIPVACALIAIVLVVLIWNERLRRQIGRRRLAEETLASQMSLQLALLENLPALVAHKDTEARFVGCNRAYEEAFGIRREDVIGKTTKEVGDFPEEQRLSSYEEDITALATGQIIHKQGEVVLADGKMHDILLWRIPFKLGDGTPGGLLTIMVDDSEQKTAERTLADQLIYQRALLDTVPHPIYIKDKNAAFIGCNLAYEQAFLANRNDLLGKTVRELPHIPDEMRQAVYERDFEILRTRKPAFSTERLPFWDGPRETLFWINSFDLADGTVGGLVGVIVDVSEQKALEQQAQEAEKLLRTALDNMSDGLYMLDNELRVQIANQKYKELLMYPNSLMQKGESIRVSMQYRAARGDYGQGDSNALIEDRVSNIVSGGLDFTEQAIGERIIETRRTRTADGDHICVAHDITDRNTSKSSCRQQRRLPKQPTG